MRLSLYTLPLIAGATLAPGCPRATAEREPRPIHRNTCLDRRHLAVFSEGAREWVDCPALCREVFEAPEGRCQAGEGEEDICQCE